MGRHAAVAGSPFTAPFGAVALVDGPARGHRGGPRTAAGPMSTGSLTRAGIAAALVTASAAAVAGSTGTFPSLGDADVASTGTNLLSVSSPDAAAVPAPRAATVMPVSLAAAPVATAPAVKTVSPAQKAAAAKAAEQAAQQKAAAAATKDQADSGSASSTAGLGSLGERIVAQAASFKGVPYVWGGTTPSGFDCSGLTKYVFGKMGISLPRTAQQQYDAAQHISQSQAQPGDLVFMGSPGDVYHVAIYAGNGKMWTAPETGETVKLGNLFGDYSFGRIR
ncbi:C40 family peptidase [Actinomycetospora chiangmaiensis]|uniref:C40 family peptidase n=1 Tax=Actinomycetospora chiangmaiensis TaxID=402650 RepID=UPI00037A2820|nr:C40 family peptidase [Actinomycetospora chiangmaiensis]